MKRLMQPESIIFMGASNNISTMGTVQLLNLLSGGYSGKIFPIHPVEEYVLGLKAYKSVDDVEINENSLLIIVLPTHLVFEKLLESARKGIKRAVIISGGFSEVGGYELQDKLKKIAGDYQIRFLGPNCIGAINTWHSMNFTYFPYNLNPGWVGMASHSGTYICHVFPILKRYGLGFSSAISLGNEANIDIVDAISYLGEDEKTKVILLYIEGIRRGREFVKVAREVSLRKPIIALYAGGTQAGARAASLHTAALSNPDKLITGAFNQCGILRVKTLEEMFEWAYILGTQPRMMGRRVGIISLAGGPATTMADFSSRCGLEVPEFSEDLQNKIRGFLPHTASSHNPVDITFSMNIEAFYQEIPNLIFNSGEVDALLIYYSYGVDFMRMILEAVPDGIGIRSSRINAPSIDFFEQFSELMRDKFLETMKSSKKPIACCCFSGREYRDVEYFQDNGIPFYTRPETAVSALSALWRYQSFLNRRKECKTK